MGRYILVFLFILSESPSFSQNVPQLQKLKDFVQKQAPEGFDSSSRNIHLFLDNRINYLYPLYQLFRNERKFRLQFRDPIYFGQLSEYISFTEDYQSALQYDIKGYDTISIATQKKIEKTITGLKNIQQLDARKYIAFLAGSRRVIMLNEAHNKPIHRAFALLLLAELYKKGYRYLAMEMLNNYSDHSLNKLTIKTGHYSAEPVAGELIRSALEIGFRLVSYEDTLAYIHTPSQRDSMQAENIYNIIRSDKEARIFVIAGYAHIAKQSLDSVFTPMAVTFKKISGIDPLSIDQTDMTEESNMALGRFLYRAYTQQFAVKYPAIAWADNAPINVTNNTDYDLSVIQPPTVYRDGRPSWLVLGGLRKPLYIKPPEKRTYLVQAYYQSEMPQEGPGQLIPADQTYIPTNNENYLLFLRKGKYILVFRDMEYKIIGKQNIEVS
jgi:hypothetical protein